MSFDTTTTSAHSKKRSHGSFDKESGSSPQQAGSSTQTGTNAPKEQAAGARPFAQPPVPRDGGRWEYDRAVKHNGDLLYRIQQLDAFQRLQLDFHDLIQRGQANAQREGLTALDDKLYQLQKARIAFENCEANKSWLRENHKFNDLHSDGEEALKLFRLLRTGTTVVLLRDYNNRAEDALNMLNNQQYARHARILEEGSQLLEGHVEMARVVLGKCEDDVSNLGPLPAIYDRLLVKWLTLSV